MSGIQESQVKLWRSCLSLTITQSCESLLFLFFLHFDYTAAAGHREREGQSNLVKVRAMAAAIWHSPHLLCYVLAPTFAESLQRLLWPLLILTGPLRFYDHLLSWGTGIVSRNSLSQWWQRYSYFPCRSAARLEESSNQWNWASHQKFSSSSTCRQVCGPL